MHFNDLNQLIPPMIAKPFKSGQRRSIELVSAPGLGKSDWMRELHQTMQQMTGEEWGFVSFMPANFTVPDLMGFLIPSKSESGEHISRFTTPNWMIDDTGRHINSYKRGIVFADEFGQGEQDVKRGMADLFLNGRVGPHRLHDGIVVVAASNRSSDRSGVTKSFDFIINRRLEIQITPDVASWEAWAHKAGVDPLFVAFANQNPEIVFSGVVPVKQGPFCTPRSLVACCDDLRAITPQGNLPTDTRIIELISGRIGEAAAQQLVAFIRMGYELPTFDEIVSDPDGTRVPKKADAQMLSIYQLSSRVTEKTAAPVLTYVDRFPKEFAATFARSTCARLPELVMTDAFGEWCAKNATLVNMLNSA